MAMYSVNPEIDATLSDATRTDLNPSRVVFTTYPATNWSNSNIKWTIIPPSMDTIVNRAMQVQIPIQIDFVGTTTGTNMLDDGYDALRSACGLRIQSNTNISFNGTSLPVSNVYDMYPDILVHYDREYRKKQPLSAPDVTTDYNDSVGIISNPLSSYSSSEQFEYGGLKRGAFEVVSITRSPTSAQIKVILFDWIYVPKLMGCDEIDSLGFSFLRDINIDSTLQLVDKWLWSHNSHGATTITSATCTLYSQPNIICKFMSVPNMLKPTENLVYNHLRFERFTTSYGAQLVPLATGTLFSNNIQLPLVPRYMYMFVRENDANKTRNSTDSFCSITNIKVDFNTQSNLLSSASQYDLWRMSQECGLMDNWGHFNGKAIGSGFVSIGTSSSPLCLAFGDHVSLGDESVSIGSSGQFNFKVTVDFKNQSTATTIVAPVLYIVLAFDQVMTITTGGQVLLSLPQVLSYNGLVSASGGADGVVKVPYPKGGMARYPSSASGNTLGNVQGAGFLDFMKKVGKFFKDNKILSSIGKIISPLVSTAFPAAAPIASMVTSGLEKAGLGVRGGQALSKKDLKNMIKDL